MDGSVDQRGILDKAMKVVKERSFFMKKAMDTEDFRQVILFATDMLAELKTSSLTPKNYYNLYMMILDELRFLEEYFMVIFKNGHSMVQLYSEVQWCTSIIPRIYLLITVGSCYIMSQEVAARDILIDLIEMVKGVQQPMRGLFMRHYLCHALKNKLPEVGSEFETETSDVSDALDFILKNFIESNRLWVRMQNQGPAKERANREKERQELKLLVGSNLVRMSQLEGLDISVYQTVILPKVFEQVVTCKDTIAQSYLMDCIIQVFPDEFHLSTLDSFFQVIPKLKDRVPVRPIFENLMERLIDYNERTSNAAIGLNENAYESFRKCWLEIENQRTTLPIAERILIQADLLRFSLSWCPGNMENLNDGIDHIAAALSTVLEESIDDEVVVSIEKLLSVPLSLGLRVLELAKYNELMRYLPWENSKQIALRLLRAALEGSMLVSSPDMLEKLLVIIRPLLRDEEKTTTIDVSADQSEDQENFKSIGDATATSIDFEAEQLLVARFVHLLQHDDTDELFKMHKIAKDHFKEGGVQRIPYTLVPLLFSQLKLVHRVRKRERACLELESGDDSKDTVASKKGASTTSTEEEVEVGEDDDDKEAQDGKGETEDTKSSQDKADSIDVSSRLDKMKLETSQGSSSAKPTPPKISSRKIFVFMHDAVMSMSSCFPILSLKLLLQFAKGADNCEYPVIAYEFISQAFSLYEEELADSRAQVGALYSMIGTLINCKSFEKSDYDSLVTKTAQYSAKLLKKPDQCRLVSMCSHLFWAKNSKQEYRDSKRVLECLQRALKIADVCMSSSTNVQLFVEILNQYLYFFEEDNEEITDRFITELIALIREHINSFDTGEKLESIEKHFENTVDYVSKRKRDSEASAKFASIRV